MSIYEVAGCGGNVTFPSGMGFGAYEWSGTLDNPSIQVPAAFGEAWKVHKAGAGASFRGSVRGKAIASLAPFSVPTAGGCFSDVLEGTATFTVDTDDAIGGTFVFSNFSISRPHNGICEVACDFVNVGDLSTGTAATHISW